jgi:glycosyltransferase involved in cell wall biosynthesis
MSNKVSIITPSYNRANIIHETAESIFRQTYPNWEWIIVDDGSSDNSWEVINKYAEEDSRVKVFKRDREPKGACTCRNIAVAKCTGDFLIFLDTDDLLSSFCIEQRLKAIQSNAELDFIVFPMLMFKNKPDDLKLLWNIDSKVDDIERILIGDPVCQGTGTLWKKKSFVKAGMWSEQLLLWQDIELHLRVLLQDLKYVKRLDLQPDVFIRISDISLSRTGYHSLQKFLSRLTILKETTDIILQKNKLNQYKVGLRHMFTDLFINAAGSNYHQQVDEMLELQKNWSLFSDTEHKNLKRYAFIRKQKIYKIPFLQKNTFKQITKGLSQKKPSLNQIIYTKKIKF